MSNNGRIRHSRGRDSRASTVLQLQRISATNLLRPDNDIPMIWKYFFWNSLFAGTSDRLPLANVPIMRMRVTDIVTVQAHISRVPEVCVYNEYLPCESCLPVRMQTAVPNPTGVVYLASAIG